VWRIFNRTDMGSGVDEGKSRGRDKDDLEYNLPPGLVALYDAKRDILENEIQSSMDGMGRASDLAMIRDIKRAKLIKKNNGHL